MNGRNIFKIISSILSRCVDEMSWNCNKNCGGHTCSKLAFRDLLCVSIVLVMIIVCLITLNVGCDKETSERYSFASTIVSIVLSVIAIIMSLLSGYKNDKAQDSLDTTLKSFREVSEHISSNGKEQIKQMKALENRMTYKLESIERKLNSTFSWTKSMVPKNKQVKVQSWTDFGDSDGK